MLFNIYGEYVIRRTLDDWERGFAVGRKRITNLRNADDTVLDTSIDNMRKLIQRRSLLIECEEVGFAINKSKTKLMIIDRTGKLSNIDTMQDTVDNFTYLGSCICKDGCCVPEIKRRITMTKDAMSRSVNIWKNRGITKKDKNPSCPSLSISHISIRNGNLDHSSQRRTKDRRIRNVVLEANAANILDC